jgi:hypothetical protein
VSFDDAARVDLQGLVGRLTLQDPGREHVELATRYDASLDPAGDRDAIGLELTDHDPAGPDGDVPLDDDAPLQPPIDVERPP